jgi:hypothetical protein
VFLEKEKGRRAHEAQLLRLGKWSVPLRPSSPPSATGSRRWTGTKTGSGASAKSCRGLAGLVDSVYLHDARVLDMWQGRRGTFGLGHFLRGDAFLFASCAIVGYERRWVPDDVCLLPNTHKPQIGNQEKPQMAKHRAAAKPCKRAKATAGRTYRFLHAAAATTTPYKGNCRRPSAISGPVIISEGYAKSIV